MNEAQTEDANRRLDKSLQYCKSNLSLLILISLNIIDQNFISYNIALKQLALRSHTTGKGM